MYQNEDELYKQFVEKTKEAIELVNKNFMEDIFKLAEVAYAEFDCDKRLSVGIMGGLLTKLLMDHRIAILNKIEEAPL